MAVLILIGLSLLGLDLFVNKGADVGLGLSADVAIFVLLGVCSSLVGGKGAVSLDSLLGDSLLVGLVDVGSHLLVRHISDIALGVFHLLGRAGGLCGLLGTLLGTLLGVGADVDVDLLVDLDRSLASTESKGTIGVGSSVLLVRENLLLEVGSDEG